MPQLMRDIRQQNGKRSLHISCTHTCYWTQRGTASIFLQAAPLPRQEAPHGTSHCRLLHGQACHA